MLTTNGLSHREMAYMCSKCVWFHFVWKELWVCFYLRKEHGMHMHSFLKWETLIEFNRSFVWAGNSELSSMGDDFGFSGQDLGLYLPNFLGLSVRHKAGGLLPVSYYHIWCNCGRSHECRALAHFHWVIRSVWVNPLQHCQMLRISPLCVRVCVWRYLISWVFTPDVNIKKGREIYMCWC